MKTSYFANVKYINPCLVSVALTCPIRGIRAYPKLFPPVSLLRYFKYSRDAESIRIKTYTSEYNQMLKTLDPKLVYAELGEDAILLCWEGRNNFCHRRLIAGWFLSELGIMVPEVEGRI